MALRGPRPVSRFGMHMKDAVADSGRSEARTGLDRLRRRRAQQELARLAAQIALHDRLDYQLNAPEIPDPT
jgi:hypothetical protein